MSKLVMKAIPAALLLASAASSYALTPGSGAWVKETATYGTPNLQEAYVFVPKNTAPTVLNGKRALMISIHGCGQKASTHVIDTKFNWESTAEQYGMVVVAPTVPSGTTTTRSVSGCWDWFGANHTRTTRDAVPLKKLIDAVKARADLDIDPNQVYVSGLSSGGGETVVMGCSFPDIFAGIGINAGPALGSGSSDISMDPKVTAAQVASNCKSANGNSYNSYFATQIAGAVYGTSDSMVKPSHNVRNLEGLAQIYGVTMSNPTTSTVTGGGTAKVYKDGNGRQRISDLSVSGMSHAWPAGGGAGASYVDNKKVNYPAYLTKWLFDNNLRLVVSSTTTTTAGATTTTAGATTTTTGATTSTAGATTTTAVATTTTTTVASGGGNTGTVTTNLTPGSGTWVKETAAYGTPNLQDAYVYVPKNTAPTVLAGKRALMLTMHGCGQTATGNVIEGAFNWEATAEKYGMVIVAPTVPSGTTSTRAVSGCWDWFGTGETRTNRDQVPLKKLMDAVMARTNLNIDPNQVYVTGLSSGAGETLAMACAFPDLFAGFGSNAGPTIGAAAGDISVAPKIAAAQVAANCKSYSGTAYADKYNTQLAAVVYGDKDTLVLPAHNTRNLEGFGSLYGVAMSNPVSTSVTGGGTAKVYKDANGKERLSDLVVSGMSHAWPAGSDAPKKNIAYVDSTRVNYPVYITEWFFKNNMRVVIIAAPASVTTSAATNSSLSVSWAAVSGAASYNVYRDGTKVASVTGTSFSDTGLNPGSTYTYTVTAVANGSESVKSVAAQGTTTGTPLVLAAPAGLAGSSTAVGSVTLTWNVVSGAKAYNVYRNGTKVASPTEATYTDSGLSTGSYSYTVSTLNSASVEGAQSAAVSVSPVAYSQTVTDTVVNHYNAKRLTLNQYLGLGGKLGYTASVTLYNCSGTWTNQANCSAMSY